MPEQRGREARAEADSLASGKDGAARGRFGSARGFAGVGLCRRELLLANPPPATPLPPASPKKSCGPDGRAVAFGRQACRHAVERCCTGSLQGMWQLNRTKGRDVQSCQGVARSGETLRAVPALP